MPPFSIWMIRGALGSLIVSSLLGALLMLHKAIPFHGAAWAMLPFHYELAVWGFLIPFVMGTAYWIFPRQLKGEPRGHPASATITAVSYTAGLIIHLAEMGFTDRAGNFPVGRILIMISIILFIGMMWGRTVSYRDRR
jgi:hypothetical protein